MSLTLTDDHEAGVAAAAPPAPSPKPRGTRVTVPRQAPGRAPRLDPSRPADEGAPHGYQIDGTPYAPHGRTADGKVRRYRKHDGETDAAPDRTVVPRPRVAPEDASKATLYRQIEASVDHQRRLVAQIRQSAPDTKIGDPVDPRGIGTAIVRADPTTPATVIEGWLRFGTEAVYTPLSIKARPGDAAYKDAGQKCAEATRYFGATADPKAWAIGSAVFAVVMLALPALLEVLGRWLGKAAGPPPAKAATPPTLEQPVKDPAAAAAVAS